MQLSLSVLSELSAAPADALIGLPAASSTNAPEESFAQLLPQAEADAATAVKSETDPVAEEAAALLAASWLNPNLPPVPVGSWQWGLSPLGPSAAAGDALTANPPAAPAALAVDPADVPEASAVDLTQAVNPPVDALSAVTAESARGAGLELPLQENIKAARVALREEKIAAGLELMASKADALNHLDKKDFLLADHTSFNDASVPVGTRVAKEMAPMIFNPTNHSKPAAAELAVGAFTHSLTPPATFTASVEAPAPVAAVRETLAAVVAAIESLEHRASGAASRVDLQFQVGGDDLGVRVEWREGTLHTFFRTDSTELRAALAHEWQSAIPPVVSREFNVAPPVFGASADRSPDFSSLNSGHPQDRPAPAPARGAATKRSGSSAQGVVAAAPTGTATPSLSLLHAFA